MSIELLRKMGLSDKTAQVYLALLRLGPNSVRKLAEFCGLNRGTVYDSLRLLQEQGLVNFYKKDTKQCFVAEDPAKLRQLVRSKKEELEQVDTKLDKTVLELQAVYNRGGERPVARYYEKNELARILEDILATCEEDEEKTYRIYSAEGVKEYLYGDFSTFSDVRIAKGIAVKAISLGGEGELRGLDERKRLKNSADTSTYIIIYPGKTAYISLDAKKEPIGVVIENDGIYRTQKEIFDNLWDKI
ncbi:MAG: ArsR family transcriptional regulator [Candidatus Magasanikbacteria bacterium]|nr:ArsR family transcriptional regulator [Candidatus Magasanikbacteria bacterium]